MYTSSLLIDLKSLNLPVTIFLTRVSYFQFSGFHFVYIELSFDCYAKLF